MDEHSVTLGPEKARLQAEAKAAEEARQLAEAEAAAQAAAEAKRKRELEREAARQALLQASVCYEHKMVHMVFVLSFPATLAYFADGENC